MPQAATPLSSPSPQGPATAPGPQPAPAASLTPVQILWDVATLAFGLLTRLVNVLRPVQSCYLAQSRQVARLLIDLPRIFLTIRFAPERVTVAQLRHLTRARHILQALFGYSLGARTPSSATPANTPSPSPNSPGARKPSSATPANTPSPSPDSPSATSPGARKPASAIPTIRQVAAIPSVPGVSATPDSPSASQGQQSQIPPPQSALGNPQSAMANPHASHNPQSAIHNPQSSFAPYIPDFHTLAQALKATSLPANCAGALLDEPGDALVRALHQLHAVYFSLYPNNQSPAPSQSDSSFNPQSAICNPQSSPAPSQSDSSFNPQSAICNLQSSPSPSSGNLQSTICNPQSPSVHPVHPVHPVHNVHNTHNVHLGPPAPP